jgi:hypothetical protein
MSANNNNDLAVRVKPKLKVRLSDVSDPKENHHSGNVVFSTDLNGVDASVDVPLEVIQSKNIRGTKVILKKDKAKLTYDVASKPEEAVKFEYGESVDMQGRMVDLDGKYESDGHVVTVQAATNLDDSTRLSAKYNLKTQGAQAKLSYSYDQTTLDATHNFSTNRTQLDITRKLNDGDTLKLTTYSGSKETELSYNHHPIKVTLNVPASADKVSGSVTFEKEFIF